MAGLCLSLTYVNYVCVFDVSPNSIHRSAALVIWSKFDLIFRDFIGYCGESQS